jgi:hypothetical protein
MIKRVLIFLLVILFSGCNTKVNEVFNKDTKYITLMQYTKRAEIVNSLETIAIINITYLNPIIKKSSDDVIDSEIFIVGVYNSNDYKGHKKGGLNNPNYTLTMNDINFTKASKVDLVKLNIKNYPFYNKWMKYYKVYFPKSQTSLMRLKYTNTLLNKSVTINIQKNLY